jgi:hypothetical protein
MFFGVLAVAAVGYGAYQWMNGGSDERGLRILGRYVAADGTAIAIQEGDVCLKLVAQACTDLANSGAAGYDFWQNGPADAVQYVVDGDNVVQIYMGWRGVVSCSGDGIVSHISWTQGQHGGQIPEGMARWTAASHFKEEAAQSSDADNILIGQHGDRFNNLGPSMSGALRPGDIEPRRLGLKYTPPTLVIEFWMPETSKLMHRLVELQEHSLDQDPVALEAKIRRSNLPYLTKIKPEQVKRFLVILQKRNAPAASSKPAESGNGVRPQSVEHRRAQQAQGSDGQDLPGERGETGGSGLRVRRAR